VYIQNNVQILKNVKNSSNNIFVLHSQKDNVKSFPLVDKLEDYTNNYSVQDIQSSDFMEAVNQSKHFLYYFGPINLWPEALRNDVGPTELLHISEEEHNYESETSIWMGHKEVTATLHFDKSHNFFVQLHGTKRFLLFAPSEWPSFYLYPSIHPKYHQTQVNWEHLNLDKFPKFPNAKGYEAILQPGDLMYIPPYWFHRVESQTFCISASTVSVSKEEQLFNEAYWKALPISQSWNTKKKKCWSSKCI